MSKLGPNDPCHCGSGKKYKKCHMHRDKLAVLQGDKQAMPTRPQPTVLAGTISPAQPVPDHIVRPDYAESGRPGRGARGIRNCKTGEQLERMRHACRMAREVLDTAVAAVQPGVTTDEIDRIAHEAAIARNCYPSPLNYHGFPKSICTSVNEVICHGIPDSRALKDGDIVNVDITVYVDGMHGDNSAMVCVGNVDAASRKLVDVTQECLMAGIGQVRPGVQLNQVGRAIEQVAMRDGYGVVTAFVGHGIGETFHMDPQVPHYYDPKLRYELQPGMTFTIEPMINMGNHAHTVWDDDWTAVTVDLQRSAQWEHTLLVTEVGVEILTLGVGEAQPFAH